MVLNNTSGHMHIDHHHNDELFHTIKLKDDDPGLKIVIVVYDNL